MVTVQTLIMDSTQHINSIIQYRRSYLKGVLLSTSTQSVEPQTGDDDSSNPRSRGGGYDFTQYGTTQRSYSIRYLDERTSVKF